MDNKYLSINDFKLYEEIKIQENTLKRIEISSISSSIEESGVEESDAYLKPVDLALPTKSGTLVF